MLDFHPVPSNLALDKLRHEVRQFLAEEAAAGSFDPLNLDPTARFDRAFSEKIGSKGWIGLSWPHQFGGQARPYVERYVITEELLVGNAPVRAHFVADRQSGPVLMRYAQPHVRDRLLPKILAGRASFCIGMSEPDSGSDLFAARAKAERVDGGYRLNGRKLWTTLAHRCDWMIGLFRTSPRTDENRRHGLTQFLIDMKSPGIEVRPVLFPTGEHDFNEVLFEDVFVAEDHVLGVVDEAWKQATSELAFERSGPERFVEVFAILPALIDLARGSGDLRIAEALGFMLSQLSTYRNMAMAISAAMDAGHEPVTEASVVKVSATAWQQDVVDMCRDLARLIDLPGPQRDRFEAVFAQLGSLAPKLTIQGGTNEILLGIIARSLGLR
jgi:acyl-CoA dehydrogenase